MMMKQDKKGQGPRAGGQGAKAGELQSPGLPCAPIANHKSLGPWPSAHGPSRRPAFTLVEVLMAMAIFLIGMVAVAAIFPAAAMVQKRTIDQVHTTQIENSMRALLETRKFEPSQLHGGAMEPETDPLLAYDVRPLHQRNDLDSLPIGERPTITEPEGWTLRDRTYPTTIGFDSEQLAHFFWVPVIQIKTFENNNPNDPPSEWRIFAFILRRDRSQTYVKDADFANWHDPEYVPGVIRVPAGTSSESGSGPRNRFNFNNYDTSPNELHLQVGDQLLDSHGTIHRIMDIDPDGGWVQVSGFIEPIDDGSGGTIYPDAVWYGHPGTGRGSPCRKIIMIVQEAPSP